MPPRPQYPFSIEKYYASVLLRRCQYLYDLLISEIDKSIIRLDAEVSLFFSALMSKINSVRDFVSRTAFKGTNELRRIGREVDRFVSRQVERTTRISTIKNSYSVEGWVSNNVSLIKSIDSRFFDDVANQIIKAHQNGTLESDLSSILEKRFQVSKNRARVIARDQIGKLNGNITTYRHQSMGIRQYIWLTSGKENVRPANRARNGKIFEYGNPPSDGNPGEQIQCQCTAIAVLSSKYGARS